MAHRLCVKCKAAENPLGSLRFKKSRMDGKVYCENCSPLTESLDHVAEEAKRFAPSAPTRKPSAGYVVVGCPDCAGGVHRPHAKPCTGCAGYGSVRMEAAMLNVWKPQLKTDPAILTED